MIRPSPYCRTVPDVTLTMNDGGVFRALRSSGAFIRVRQQAAERFTNQDEPSYPVSAPLAAPRPPCMQAIEVLDVDV